MMHAEAALLAENVLKAGLDLVLWGPQECGKTTLCRQLAPEAPLLHATELGHENMALFRSLVGNTPVLIVENADAKTVQFLKPFLDTRTALGMRFECRFLMTAREDFALEGASHIRLAPIEAQGWLLWAQKNRIHPALRLLVENDERILARHGGRKLEALSKLLSARPSNKSLRASIESVLGNDEAALLALLSAMSEPVFQSGSSEEALVEKARTGTQENVRRFESELLEGIKNGPTKETELRFIHYLKEAPAKEVVMMLSSLIDSPKAQSALAHALSDAAVKSAIDSLLRELL